jgi:hypothetical protein
MARKPKKPWNADLKMPGFLGEPPSPPPPPMPVTPVPLGTSALMGDMRPARIEETDHECLRCVRIKDGRDPLGFDHTPRCPFRGSGKDPDRN